MSKLKHARIKPVDVKLTEPLKSKMAKIFPENIPAPALFRSVARNESLFIDMIDMNLIGPTGLLDRKTIPTKLREILILRTCVVTNNDYEFNLHIKTISKSMGVSSQQLTDVKQQKLNIKYWHPSELALITLIDGLVNRIRVNQSVFDEAKKYFNDSVLIELVQLIGLYTGVAMMVALIQPELDLY